jgi:hypothetical protein
MGRRNSMETHISNIVKRHSDGAMVTLRLEPAKDMRSAARFKNKEDYETFIKGHYGPDDPTDYYLQPIKITYEEATEDE